MPPQEQCVDFDEDVSPKTRRDVPERKRKISFALNLNQVLPIQHIKDMSKAEIRSTWYDRQDYEGMKQTMIPVIRRLMKGEVIEESNSSTARGLEYRTRKGAIRRQHNKLEAISAVLDELDRQYNDGELNDDMVSEVYRTVAGHCQDEAYVLGLQDEAAAKAIFAEPSPVPAKELSDDESSEDFEDDLADSEKKSRRLTKLFKQVRIRRRALLEDMRSLDHTRSMPQAA